MEELENGPTPGGAMPVTTAEKLRALREKLGRTLENHRIRVRDIEAELNTRVQKMSLELARDRTPDDSLASEIEQRQDLINRLQESVAQKDTELSAKEEELAVLQDQLQSQLSDEEVRKAEYEVALASLRDEVAAERASRDSSVSELEAAKTREFEEKQQELLSKIAEREQQIEECQQQIASLESSLSDQQARTGLLESNATEQEQVRQQLVDELDSARRTIASLEERESVASRQSNEELTALQERLQKSNSEFQKLSAEHESTLAELENVRKELEELRRQECEQNSRFLEEKQALEQSVQELSFQLKEMTSERDTVCSEVQALRNEMEELRNQECEECVSLKAALSEAEDSSQQADDQLQQLGEELDSTNKTLEESLAKNEETSQLLKEAEHRILELSKLEGLNEQLEQTQRKFELAVDDVNRLKRENAQLQEELTQRPEQDETESPALVSLRAERDALAVRIAELEDASQQVVDEDSQQQIDDLQRRFELAVEDLRAVKQENVDLKSQLASKSPSISTSSNEVGDDWEAQKERLLAALESEDEESVDEDRQEERAKIEGTIAITDRIVAEKEQEIAELRGLLESQTDSDKQEAPSPEAELLDKDEVIQAERTRLEQLQQEWQEKLREAELEMSLQRAALARRETELQHKLEEIKHAEPVESTVDGKPRRRWLSALGIRDDEEDQANEDK